MKLARLTAAACAALVAVAGCGADDSAPTQAPTPPPTTLSDKVARSGGPASRGGERTSLGSGLTITVSEAKSFVPTNSASPPAVRAVGFDMAVENDGPAPYKPTLLSLSATANGTATQQVIDSTQGYTGVVGGPEVKPGETLRFSVAFAVPQEKTWVHIGAAPEPGAGSAVTVFSETA
ncbi:hypothetical protein UO65_6120 [Actinokineospora spheciospongiae]|uniref:DUF4352 domain-containing protein n=1 Tax=Actinokineospora spheciospongiae TaxID=909613 RepID=W7IX37_9PSEU|nr:hypothetical protein [Actinokineospora spheciospongiae]EWC58574.1 hypothetical protein UO65_6120 [Actinokineospora spheciospongiae]PWW56258.1 hypothetical protein DFQ13_111197 [Actinokineospora spheciospongiae]